MGSTYTVNSYGLSEDVLRKLTSMVLNGEIHNISPADCNGNHEAQNRVKYLNELINRLNMK